MSRFIPVDRQTDYLLPPSVDEWLPDGHLARFVVDVVEQLDLSTLTRRYMGRGSKAHHPAVLLSLLIYGYATGVVSSRKIERATYDSVAFRYLAANTHPDHDTLATFRRRFLPELEQLFVQVLLLAREMKLLKLGTIALDGTKLKANASKHKALSYGHAKKLEAQFRAEVKALTERAESADKEDAADGMDIPAEEQRAAGVGPLHAGTTAVAAVLAQHEGDPAWLLANLGDSRAYRVAGGSLEQVTVDHSVVQELVDTGLITAAAAAEHPERHVITRSLGGNQRSEPDLFVLPLAAAPRLVLCSDGISGMLDHEQMRGVLAADADPGRAADALLAAALDAGGRDNATVVVVDALTDPDPDTAADTAAVGAETPTDVDLEQRLGVLP